jgi:hypothetical protein
MEPRRFLRLQFESLSSARDRKRSSFIGLSIPACTDMYVFCNDFLYVVRVHTPLFFIFVHGGLLLNLLRTRRTRWHTIVLQYLKYFVSVPS